MRNLPKYFPTVYSYWPSETMAEVKCKIGVIADVQYADVEDGHNFAKTVQRYYRNALNLLSNAVDTWLGEKEPMQCVLQLGDVIDGRSKRAGKSTPDLKSALDQFQRMPFPTYHILGNHEFYNFPRKELLQSELYSHNLETISTPNPGSTAYYHTSPALGVRIVCIDPYDISMLGYDYDAPQYKEARTLLKSVNQNKDMNDSSGLFGYERRYVKFNGALGKEQLQWLDQVLTAADRDGEIAIVAGHIPLLTGASDAVCLVWNSEDVLQLLARHPCVQMYLAGHTHCSAYTRDTAGIHHITLPGIVEIPPGEDHNGFGTLSVCGDRIELTGYGGWLPSRVMPLRGSPVLNGESAGHWSGALKNCDVF